MGVGKVKENIVDKKMKNGLRVVEKKIDEEAGKF